MPIEPGRSINFDDIYGPIDTATPAQIDLFVAALGGFGSGGGVPVIFATAANFQNGTAFPSGQTTLLSGQIGYQTDTNTIKFGRPGVAYGTLANLSIVGGSGGSGDVVGPATVVSGHAAVFSGTTGKLIGTSGAAPVTTEEVELRVLKSDTIPLSPASVQQIREGSASTLLYVSPNNNATANLSTLLVDHAGGDLTVSGLNGPFQAQNLLANTTLIGLSNNKWGEYSSFYHNPSTTANVVITFSGALTFTGSATITLTPGTSSVVKVSQYTTSTGLVRTHVQALGVTNIASTQAPTFTGSGGSVTPNPFTPGAVITLTPSFVGTPAPTETRVWRYNDVVVSGQTANALPTNLNEFGTYNVDLSLTNSAGGPVTKRYTAHAGPAIPVWIGTTSTFSAGVAATFSMPLPTGGALADAAVPIAVSDYILLAGFQKTGVNATWPAGFDPLSGGTELPRISTLEGNNGRMGMAGRYLTQADIDLGLIEGMLLSAASMVNLAIVRGVDLANWDSTAFTRTQSPYLNANTLNAPSRTFTQPTLSVMYVASGDYQSHGGTSLALSGWTTAPGTTGVSAGAGRLGGRFMYKKNNKNVATPGGTISVGGTATITITGSIVGLNGPVTL